MKCLNKLMVFFLSLLFSYGIDTFGYTYTITNMTGRKVKVQLDWAWGELTNGGAIIGSYDTRTLHFGGWDAGLCLTEIWVSRKRFGKWEKARETIMGTVKGEDRFEELKKSGFIGKFVAKGIRLFGLNMCQSRYFVLVRDWMSGKTYAITSIDI